MEFSISQRDFAFKFSSVTFTTVLVITAGCKLSPSDAEQNHKLLQHRPRSNVQNLDAANIGDTVSNTVASEIFDCLIPSEPSYTDRWSV
jgi:ABC-type oligopeptide transport system substrate-binding subunit